MKYAMLATLIPRELEAFYKNNTKGSMQDAANALQWNIYNGICTNLNIDIPIFNIMPVDSFPQYYKYPFITKSHFDKMGINIGFCNIKLLRNNHMVRKIYKVLEEWVLEETDDKTLFVYTISQPFLEAVSQIKKKYADLKVCAIVADLPDMTSLSSQKSFVKKMYIKYKSAQAYKKVACVDYFVLLTAQMADYMKITQPYCVMEGIASPYNSAVNLRENVRENKIVMYSGTLHKRFGILHLVEAFGKIAEKDFALIICGIGDGEADIQQAAKKDSRIQFKGQLAREEVLKLQRSATVLVNPRLNNEEFTKYSFPSKTMEYLASGVPVIAYKLDGIPEEYDEFIIRPRDDSSDELAQTIKEMCILSEQERKVIGEKGKKFVLENKNYIIQSRKILNFIDNQNGKEKGMF